MKKLGKKYGYIGKYFKKLFNWLCYEISNSSIPDMLATSSSS